MKTVAIDASAAASWLLPGQRTSEADAFLLQGDYERLIAPDIFIWEIGNLIVRRLDRGDQNKALATLALLQIEVAAPRSRDGVLDLIDPACRRGLSLFDAAYLQLCLQTDAVLASRDMALLGVAQRAGVAVLNFRDQT